MSIVSTFYFVAAIALVAALGAITRKDAVHAILYLVVMMVATAILFFLLGASFSAALQIIVYAGAIIILFLFVIMMVNPPPTSRGSVLRGWLGPVALAGTLGVIWYFLLSHENSYLSVNAVEAGVIGQTLFEKYAFAIHLIAVFLLVGLVGAYHIGNRKSPPDKHDPSKPEALSS